MSTTTTPSPSATTTPTTRAWTYTTPPYPSTLHLSTLPSSTQSPPAHHLHLQIHAASLNPADIQLMNLPLWSLPFLSYPKVPGADFAATVLAAGADCTFAKGDEIFGFSLGKSTRGFLAEEVLLDERIACVAKKPAAWSWVQAASVPLVYLTARTCVGLCEPYFPSANSAGAEGGGDGGHGDGEGEGAEQKSKRSLVVLGGSSAVGMHVIQLAKRRGWAVLATCSARNADFVRETVGADEVVDYTTQDVVSKVKEYQPTAIVDCVGGTECVGLAGLYVSIVGDKIGRGSIGGSVLYAFNPRMVLRWVAGWVGLGKRYHAIALDARREWLEKAAEELSVQKIVVDSVYGFERVREAYARLDTARARGKVVVVMDE